VEERAGPWIDDVVDSAARAHEAVVEADESLEMARAFEKAAGEYNYGEEDEHWTRQSIDDATDSAIARAKEAVVSAAEAAEMAAVEEAAMTSREETESSCEEGNAGEGMRAGVWAGEDVAASQLAWRLHLKAASRVEEDTLSVSSELAEKRPEDTLSVSSELADEDRINDIKNMAWLLGKDAPSVSELMMGDESPTVPALESSRAMPPPRGSVASAFVSR
jgi:hypothetical protein